MSLTLDSPEKLSAQERSRKATWAFRAVVLLVFAILVGQLWRLQIVDGRSYVDRSAANSLRTAVIPPERGIIYDRNKTLLASNAPVFVVSITPADLPDNTLGDTTAQVASQLHIDPQQIQQVLNDRKGRSDFTPFTAIPVWRGTDRDAVMRLSERQADLPGVQVSVASTRQYTDGPLISSIVGYMLPIASEDLPQLENEGYAPDDRVGAAGVEQWYEGDLRGSPGKRLYQVDVTGHDVGELRRDDVQPGNNLMLSIDLNLQRDVQQILQDGLRNTPSGAAIVMDPRNGEVLAMASSPTFDDNVISDPARQDELQQLLDDTSLQPMFPRAYEGMYAPGSVFKLVTGSAALQQGVATPSTVIVSTGELDVKSDLYPGVVQRLPDTFAYGPENFFQGLANSSNVYFMELGGGYQDGATTVFKGLGADALAAYARGYGYGSATGLDVQGEQDGTIPDPRWKQLTEGQDWYIGDTYNMSIGQGDVLATPLQVANTTNAIANGGTVYEPHLGMAELDSNGNVVKVIQPKSHPAPVDASNLAIMRQAMEWNFEGPWLKWFKIPGLRIAGKTGTAEYAGPTDPNGNLPTHGWFTGFAPADDPQISVTVFVEAGSGTNDASPIGARIIRRYFNEPDISPDPPVLPPEPQPAPAPPR